MAFAQFALPQRSALIVGVPREHRCASLTLAHAAARGVAPGEQLNLSGHELFSLAARIVAGDALRILKLVKPYPVTFVTGGCKQVCLCSFVECNQALHAFSCAIMRRKEPPLVQRRFQIDRQSIVAHGRRHH
jgi:hypothetical protein